MYSRDAPLNVVPDRNEQYSGLRILVVDDSADTALSQGAILAYSGYEVEVAQDGPSALEIAYRLAPDVVLLDIGMSGMDGWEVAKLLLEQAHLKKPFIVAVTGRQSEEDMRRSSEVGIKLHLLKPIDQQKLGSVLREVSTTLS